MPSFRQIRSPHQPHSAFHGEAETGGLFETELCFPLNDPRARALKNISTHQIQYKKLSEALIGSATHNAYGYTEAESWDPPTRQLGTIHYLICQELKLKDWKNLRVFPSLKTSLDRHHGVDLWFAYHDEESGNDCIVTIDTSINPPKEEIFKADVLFTHYGAIPNPKQFPGMPSAIAHPIIHPTRDEQQQLDEDVLFCKARTIASVIRAKLAHGDDHYGDLATRAKIFTMLEQPHRPPPAPHAPLPR